MGANAKAKAGAEAESQAQAALSVALIRAKYNPYGGAERFVQTAVAALAAQRVTLTVLTRDWPSGTNNDASHVILNPRYFTRTGRERSFANAVRAHLETQHYDLVQSHERIVGCDVFRAGDGVHAAWLAARARVTDGIKRLGVAINPHHRYLLKTEKDMFASPSLRAVICNSSMVKVDILRHFAIDETKLRVILTGVDSDKFHPALRETLRDATRKLLRIPKTAPVVLFVGSGFERKGLVGFLTGLAELNDDSVDRKRAVHGVVVGHDKHSLRYQAFADQLGLSDRVRFVGGVDDVRPYYATADVFALPTLYDPMPNACLEAMACGLPCITSTGSGAAELISNGVEGFVTDALDTPAIAEAMRNALADANMGARARHRVLPHTPASMAAQYVALYRELLGR
jgi:UDP-glucose:(heptosyl)LPS alpha-1,3-glucosyltransferase